MSSAVMICLVALVIFCVLGIFSASHRKLALKAFDCVFRRITLRPCQSGLDQQLRIGIIGLISRKSVRIAGFTAKYFEILSWIFTIFFFASLVFSGIGIYYYYAYGNCNGEKSEGFCVFDALNSNEVSSYSGYSNISEALLLPDADDDPYLGEQDAELTIIEFGCFACHYTKKAEPVMREIIQKYKGKVRIVYRNFIIPGHNGSLERAIASECADEQGKYWEYHNELFKRQKETLENEGLMSIAEMLNLNMPTFWACINYEKTKKEIEKDFIDGINGGVKGTPTFFINNITVVGPRNFAYFRRIIDKQLE